MVLNPYRILKKIADYQFGMGAGEALFPKELMDKMEVKYSKKTKRIKYVFLEKKPYITLRSSDGFIVPSIEAAKNLVKNLESFKYAVQINNNSLGPIKDLRKVLVKHIKKVNKDLEAGSEVVIVDENNNVVGVGRAVLSGEEMMLMKRGVAVKLRKISI